MVLPWNEIHALLHERRQGEEERVQNGEFIRQLTRLVVFHAPFVRRET